MTYTWREHAEALDEYREAATWYEMQRAGWGDVFMDAVDAAIESILDPSATGTTAPSTDGHSLQSLYRTGRRIRQSRSPLYG